MTDWPLSLKVSAGISVGTTLLLLGFALFRPHGQAVGVIAGNFANVMAGMAGAFTGAGALVAGGLLYFLKASPWVLALCHALFLLPPFVVLLLVLRIYR
jgi:hypothetical protein